ncbi:MAG: cobalamin-dependent protein, partial [Alphaproteobacteria bacterium]|nr:cobalamin-dependent protein [Alphaproteobacteria bacterium]
MNWLLINPTQHFLNMFPLGLAYVSSALKAAGVDVRLLDLGFVGGGCEDTRSAIANAMREAPVDVIGIGGLYAEHPHITRVISWCREANPHAVIVAGNGVASCDPVLMLPALGADFAVIGEGEESAVALHKVLESGGDPRTVQGIAFRDKDGTVVVTEPRTKFIDLDLIPMPDYEGFQVRRYIDARPGSVYYGYSFVDNYRGLPILASRSCPLACTFCYHAIGSYRRRSVEHFFSEVKLLIEKYDVNSLQIYDDLFASKRDRVIEFCEDIKQYGLLWEISLRVQNIAPGKIDGPVLALMREAGCRSIGLGLESVSAKVLASMKKKITKEQIATALDLITQANINFQGNFIFGDRAETEETANESLDWWRRNRQYLIQTDPIWAFPGTEVYVRGKADGRIPDDATYLASPY